MRAGLRLSSLPLNVALVDRLARAYVGLAFRTDPRILPLTIRDFPRRFVALVGDEPPSPLEAQRLMEERLVYRVLGVLLRQALMARPASAAECLRALIEVGGREHLDAALARGRGAFVMTAHFGFPYLIRPVLEGYGVRVMAAQWESRQTGDVTLRGNVWERAAALHGIRAALEQDQVCVFVPDSIHGVTCSVPFLGHRISIGLGAFHLARRVPSAIVPCYAVTTQQPRRFHVEFLPPLTLDASSVSDTAQTVREFVDHYQSWIRRHLSHVDEELLRDVSA